MKPLQLALLSGGTSSERDVSLKSGDQVFAALDKRKYQVTRYDPKYDLEKLVADRGVIDFALIILHGPNGEDGTIQGLLELLNIPYQGTGVLGSSLAMNKSVSKQRYEQAGLLVPAYRLIETIDTCDPKDLIAEIGLPLVVKPAEGGSSIGMSIVHEEQLLSAALRKAFSCDNKVLVEQFVKGVEVTGGVLGNQELTALPIVEIIPDDAYDFFDYTAKYTPGATREICPARLSDALTQKAQYYARRAHRALCCSGYSRTDMIMNEETVYVLETNTIPGMTPTSLFPLAAQAAGLSFEALLERLIELGLERAGKN